MCDAPEPSDAELLALARDKALGLLARREHSRLELRNKLRQRGYTGAIIEPLLDELAAERLQSEQRFAESYTYNRVEKGYGPLRIRSELRERGVDEALQEQALGVYDEEWGDRLAALQQARYGDAAPEDYAEQARQMRFLARRGFPEAAIRRLYRS